jgi:hypothetical protein
LYRVLIGQIAGQFRISLLGGNFMQLDEENAHLGFFSERHMKQSQCYLGYGIETALSVLAATSA